ncbi:unnamed protein product [Paramecium pentaurelia]|uniref:Uncharacterized protein n=1 Tax=Paramecium pentaurelia TaxID=43138 RepID=A0A8S1W0Y3_9CILI|nr:unnamed protein product [Paramecium pentaurelia]
MSIKGKLFLSQKVDLGYKSYEDSIHPTTTIADTGSDFQFESKIQQSTNKSIQMKPYSLHSIRNIFDEVKNEERKKYKDSQIGPKYEDDKKDKVVKWSIVGKAEQFLAVRNKNRQRVVIKQRKQEGDDSFSDDVPSIKPQVLQQSQSQMSGMGQSKKIPKKPRGEFKMLPRQDALVKLVEAKHRIENDKIDNIKQELKLPLYIRNAITRDRRIFESFDQLKEKWESVNNKIASNCQRSPTETILIRSDNYRDRNIKLNIIESQKNEDEKNNDRLWYLRLRWYDCKNDRPPFSLITTQRPKSIPMTNRLINRYVKDYNAEHLNQQQNFVLADIQSNFNTKVIDNPYQQVEKVIPNTKNFNLYSKKLNQQFDEKIKNKSKKKYVDTNEYLELIGENIYKKELNFIMKEQQQEYQYFEEKQDEEEVYVDNWNNQQLSKMSQQLIQHI